MCTVKVKMTPEHKCSKKAYPLCAVVNEEEEAVVSVVCEGCVAQLGGCKHAVAFLAWLHRRSEEAAVTSTTCYWRKSVLSSVGRGLKFMKTSEMGKKAVQQLPASDGSAREEFAELCASKDIETQLTAYTSPIASIKKLSIHYLHAAFKNSGVSIYITI